MLNNGLSVEMPKNDTFDEDTNEFQKKIEEDAS